MTEEIETTSTSKILSDLENQKYFNDNDIYQMTNELIKRWDSGIDLCYLVDLLDSSNSENREQGAYYANNLNKKNNLIRKKVSKLAFDQSHYCRIQFLFYIQEFKIISNTEMSSIKHLLFDIDVHIRSQLIYLISARDNNIFENIIDLSDEDIESARTSYGYDIHDEFWSKMMLPRMKQLVSILKYIKEGLDLSNIRDIFPNEDMLIFYDIEKSIF